MLYFFSIMIFNNLKKDAYSTSKLTVKKPQKKKKKDRIVVGSDKNFESRSIDGAIIKVKKATGVDREQRKKSRRISLLFLFCFLFIY